MDKHAVRRTLDQLAAFLELKGESAFRVRAVQHAARSELLATGRSSALDELREQLPPGLAEMLRIPGLGAAKVRQIHDSLAIESLADLEAAAGDGRLAALPRFGAKTAENIRRGIASLRRASGLRLFHHAWDESDAVRRALAGLEDGRALRVEIAGAVRRRCEVIGALELVAVHAGPAARETLVKRLGQAPGVTEITRREGTVTLPDWAAACHAAGYEWVGITDHSKSAPYGGGLGAEDVARQHLEIDAVNARVSGLRVLKGVEADILADGTLDYGPDVLDRFDFVIGSIHSRFGMSEAEMTRRVLTAMDDPHLAILGHPTGRLLLQREPYAIDLEQVLATAAARGIAIEVHADPHRLDLDWRMVRRARELGVTFSIGADAHSTGGMTNVAVGLGIARKGWLEPDRVLNTRDAEAFLPFARARLVAVG